MRHSLQHLTIRTARACLTGACLAASLSLAAPLSWAAPQSDAADKAETEAAGDLTIGSEAPSLDIEHWLHAEESDQERVTDFEEGKVYVVEFWATWCGPCISSMPHLAELQQEYADKNVRIVSVSDEDLETVQTFLKRPTPQDEDQTFGELTSAYSLTTDPDGSVYADYMQAANQGGIPTAFLVGKTGKVEWIGHPMRMDEPLEALVNDSWDREQFAKEFKEAQANQKAQTQAAQLLRAGKTSEAIALLDKRIRETSSPDSKATLKQYKLRVLMSDPEMAEQAAAAVKEMLTEADGDPVKIYQASAMAYQLADDENAGSELVSLAIDKLRTAVEEVEEAGKPFLYDTLARLLHTQGKLQEAIAAEQQAVELSQGPMKNRFQSFLDDLQEEAQGDGADEPASE